MLIDTHCHLDAAEFDVDRQAVIVAARAQGVAGFLVPAVAVDNFGAVAGLSAANPDCVHAYGIHPLYVKQAREEDVDALRDRLADGTAVAVGEIGLDGFVADGDLPRQERFLDAQLKLAVAFGLPVVLHVRRAQDRVLKALRKHRPPGGIAHAFNGSRQQAEAFIGLGLKLGFGGAMTYSGSRRIRDLAATLPLSAIVLETDAPDIAPAWGAGQRNDPVNIRRMAEVLADLRGMDVAEVIEATGANAFAAIPGLQRIRAWMAPGSGCGR